MKQQLKSGMRLVVASHNQGKVVEISALVKPLGLDVVSAGQLSLAEPEETETSFIGNAKLKALAAATVSGLPSLSDDSGLEIDALAGAPGIYSARWAGPTKDFALAMQAVEDELTKVGATTQAERRANFTCALCLAWPDGETATFEGKVFGALVWPPRGDNGFGYDPIFMADGYEITFGEMEADAKHKISHRAKAFDMFLAASFA